MTDDTIAIGRLGPSDTSRARALLDLFGTAFDQPDVYGGARPDDGYLATLLGRPEVIVLVAIDGSDGVVGGLVAYVLHKLERARSEVYVYDVAVAEAYRRRGIATALFDALKPVARALGAWMIFVQADRDDPPAIALYRKLGHGEEVFHFDISPDADL